MIRHRDQLVNSKLKLENGCSMVKELKQENPRTHMPEIGLWGKDKGMEFVCTQMEINMLETSMITNSMVSESKLGMTVESTMEAGKTRKNTAMAYSQTKMAFEEMDNGKKAHESNGSEVSMTQERMISLIISSKMMTTISKSS